MLLTPNLLSLKVTIDQPFTKPPLLPPSLTKLVVDGACSHTVTTWDAPQLTELLTNALVPVEENFHFTKFTKLNRLCARWFHVADMDNMKNLTNLTTLDIHFTGTTLQYLLLVIGRQLYHLSTIEDDNEAYVLFLLKLIVSQNWYYRSLLPKAD
jgi:hypothetical protein